MAVTWMKRGKEAQAEIKKADQAAAAKAEQSHRMWRFRMKENEKGELTFVDGNLDANGIIEAPTYREHTLFFGGSWQNFVCTQDVEPCPICENGDTPSLVGVLTVIDHRPWKSKDGTKSGKDQPRLYVAKKEVLKQLQIMATKRGGLAGCRYDVARGGQKSPASGEHFDFTEKESDLEKLKAKYTRTYKNAEGKDVTETIFKPADYEKEIVFRSAKELRDMGFGTAIPVGAEKAPTDEPSTASDLDQQL